MKTIKIQEIQKKENLICLNDKGIKTDFETLEEILYSGFRLTYVEFPIDNFTSFKILIETNSHRTIHLFEKTETESILKNFLVGINKKSPQKLDIYEVVT